MEDICNKSDLSEFDDNYHKYIGWESTVKESSELKVLFSEPVFKRISSKITELLQGVHPEGNPIVVSNRVIGHMISSLLDEPRTASGGDIYTMYSIPKKDDECTLKSIIDRTVNNIVDYVRNEFEMKENNKKLTIWTTMYGDFNDHGLRAHAPIKKREKRTQSMMFNMNY